MQAATGRLRGFLFQGKMHALMASVLLGRTGEDPLNAKSSSSHQTSKSSIPPEPIRCIPQAAASIGVGGLCEAIELPIAGGRRM